jgi:hypothetical protein
MTFTRDGVPFIYAAPPVCSSISVNTGGIGGGTVVTITGTGFYNTGEQQCQLGTKWATLTYVISSTLMVCVTPSVASATTYTLSISNNNVETVTCPSFTATATPTVTGISHSSGPVRT